MTKNQLANSQKVLKQVLKGNTSNLNTSAGFTLIESLVAMVVISITLVAITPPIFWATGTRVQNRRAEQALALAQGEIDRVRAQIERGISVDSTNPADVATNYLPQSVGVMSVFKDYPAPLTAWKNVRSTNPDNNTAEKIVSGDKRYPDANQYIPVDTDGDGKNDFLVQVFRDNGVCGNNKAVCTDTNPPTMFSVKVRVYAGMAASNAGKLLIDRASLTGSTGTGQANYKPLAILSSRVAKSVNSNALDQNREYQPPLSP